MKKDSKAPETTEKPAAKRTPFFARYLESQSALRVKTSVKAGRGFTTLKYPSDGEDVAETMKYPSDGEDGAGGGGGTKE